MYALQFLADVQDGKIIIPERLLKDIQPKVQVILFGSNLESSLSDQTSLIDVLDQSTGSYLFQTKKDVELFLNEERDSWE